MTTKKRIKVGYDIDDTLMSFNVPFMDWAGKKYNIDFSAPTANGFLYNDRHEDLDVDWRSLVNEFTLNQSVKLMKPERGLISHFEKFKDVVEPFIITSRPKQHRGVTQELISKYLSAYFSNLESDLFMPDELRVNGKRPTKASICNQLGAKMFFEDAIHNYESFLDPKTTTEVVLFRTESSVWNHQVLPEGMRRIIHLPEKFNVVESWDQASEVLDNEIIREKYRV